MRTSSCPRFFILTLLLLSCSALRGQQMMELTAPAGSEAFGTHVKFLPNGNFVVTDPLFDDGATANVGAVHLCSSASGAIISTLKGSTAGDGVGGGGIVVLTTGNFVVVSPGWRNGANVNAGAVTWVNGTTGLSGVVSPSNSLVGSSTNDWIGTSFGFTLVSALPNGNYIVKSPDWNNGGSTDAGAVTFGDGMTGVSGVVSAANSMVGSTTSDKVGMSHVVLTNNHVVIWNILWDNGGLVDAGAVTWMSGTTGRSGVISAANSLVGSSQVDLIGSGSVTALSNGHYVVTSSVWNNGGTQDVGAVTWCDGTTGRTGAVSASNSLIGGAAGDQVGSQPALALTNGHYVVISKFWKNGATTGAGAVTWCDGSVGRVGVVSPANSLVGTQINDSVGSAGVTPLSNGNYIVSSDLWDLGPLANAGAVTWCSGTTGLAGPVSEYNSLHGTTAQDRVGQDGAASLQNGHAVVSSPSWNNGALPHVGAVTWIHGATGRLGPVTSDNSLTGSRADDSVGSFGILTLSNGNYVVCSGDWNMSAGAATWCNGSTGMTGTISAANSLMGSTAGDSVGENCIALTNGHYVLCSPYWDDGSKTNAGAVTWGNGTTGITGTLSSANSLIGSTPLDAVGEYGVVELDNGNYLVRSPDWDHGTVVNAGAVTFGNGTTGVKGVITTTNSFLGTGTDDHVGYQVETFPQGRYAVSSYLLDNGAAADAGAITFVSSTAIVGQFDASKGIQGIAADGGLRMRVEHDAGRQHTLISRPADNKVRYVGDVGKISFTSDLYTGRETSGLATITLTRSGGALGGLAVQVSTSSKGGTAKAGDDYTAITSQNVIFAPGVTSASFTVDIADDTTANEPNETFKVTLAGDAATLGTRTSAIVRIVDKDDMKSPTNAITFPAEGAIIPANPGDPITVTGTQTDNKGPGSVSVSINGAPYQLAAMVVNGTKGAWSVQVVPQTGLNSIQVLQLDSAGLLGFMITRKFYVSRPLVVKSFGGNATLTSGYSPSSFRPIGSLCTITAKPDKGFIFANWSLSGGATPADIGIKPADLELPTLTFIHKEGVQLTANIVPSPYLPDGIAGLYDGLVTANGFLPDRPPAGFGPEDGTPPSNSTEGYLTMSVTTSGTFSGKLTMDGILLPVAGDLDHAGEARFGASRSRSLTLLRPGKSSLVLSMQMSISPFDSMITGEVTAVGTGTASAVSFVFCDLAYYNGTTRIVSDNYLGQGKASGLFTVAFPALDPGSQVPGYPASDYPQGAGIANITVTKSGLVSLAGTLADGSSATTSGTLNGGDGWQFFIPLYNKRGFLRSEVEFDHLGVNSDLLGYYPLWLRPLQDVQHYPRGWPTGILLEMIGTKYSPALNVSALPGLSLPPFDTDGNASLIFGGGLLTETVGINQKDAVQNLPADPSFKLSINRKTGQFSGTVTAAGGKPAYKGILLPKGPAPYGTGFFLTPAPKVKDYSGQSLDVRLQGQ